MPAGCEASRKVNMFDEKAEERENIYSKKIIMIAGEHGEKDQSQGFRAAK